MLYLPSLSLLVTTTKHKSPEKPSTWMRKGHSSAWQPGETLTIGWLSTIHHPPKELSTVRVGLSLTYPSIQTGYMTTLWTWPLLAVSLSSVVGAESSLKLSKHCRQREHAMASSALFCCKKIWRLWWLSTHPIQLYCPMLEENAGKLTRLSMSFPEQKVFLKTCVGMCRCRSSWNTVWIELWTSFGWSLSCVNLRPWLTWTLRPEALRYFHAGRSAHPSNEAQSNL